MTSQTTSQPTMLQGVNWGGRFGKLCLILVIALTASCLPAQPDQTMESARPNQDLDHQQARRRMVEEQIEARGITDPRVLEAMSRVPRHEFVPSRFEDFAYNDTPLRIEFGQTISQPYIVALMTELLQPEPGDRILEIGTGS